VNWATVLRYNGPFGSWNSDSLGSVFGLTLMTSNIVAHTSCYIGDPRPGRWRPGAIYRIDATTAAVPRSAGCRTTPILRSVGDDRRPRQHHPDRRHRQIFATNPKMGAHLPTAGGERGRHPETFDPRAGHGPTNYLTPALAPPLAGAARRAALGREKAMDALHLPWAEDLDTNSPTPTIRSVA
jgi:hypothetical protein